MQKMATVLISHVLVLLFVSSYAWSRQIPEDADLIKRMYSQLQLKRPMYDFGLGKRSLEEAASYEDFSPLDAYQVEDKRAAGPNSMYSFGLGKRNRAYGFGLGKRLEAQWKYPSTSRQERRSKIYSFGLGKRTAGPMYNGLEDYYDIPVVPVPVLAGAAAADKRATGGSRQFSFGLGKRDVADASHNTTS